VNDDDDDDEQMRANMHVFSGLPAHGLSVQAIKACALARPLGPALRSGYAKPLICVSLKVKSNH
jgi:hypothetical protein